MIIPYWIRVREKSFDISSYVLMLGIFVSLIFFLILISFSNFTALLLLTTTVIRPSNEKTDSLLRKSVVQVVYIFWIWCQIFEKTSLEVYNITYTGYDRMDSCWLSINNFFLKEVNFLNNSSFCTFLMNS